MPAKSKDTAYLTIAIPKSEMKRVKAAAEKDSRPMSNWAWAIIKERLDKDGK